VTATAKMRKTVLLGVCGLLMLPGCSDSGFESSFVYSSATTSLIREAQDGVQDAPGVKRYLDERFGTPQDLKAWLKLPISYGGTPGSVVSWTAASAQPARIVVAVTTEHVLPEEPQQVLFLTGLCAGQSVDIVSWNQETGEAVLAAPPTETPAAGDEISIDGGSTLRSGRGLYMRHCSHCHGTSGDGNGPTAEYLNPRPRDYRNGIFKFTSTDDASRVSRDDLTRSWSTCDFSPCAVTTSGGWSRSWRGTIPSKT
jgi:hypothetical protein